MNTKVQVLENSQVELLVEVGREIVENAITRSYNAMKSNFNIPGFRKGKVPRHIIEKMYGVEVFFDRAADNIINETFQDAIKENDIDMVAKLRSGDIEVTQMSKENMTYKAKVTVKPDVVLGEYKNQTIEVESSEVTDEEIDSFINQEATKNAREIKVTDRAVQPQDKVTIDFTGFVDGVPFEGGSGEDYALVIGSKTFIPGFEDQLIGKNIGDEVDVNVEFPEDYQSEELKGKPALFKVNIKEIEMTELPEIDDDFAADVSEFDTIAEYKADVKKNLTAKKEEERKIQISNSALDKAIENATFTIPENMIEEEIDRQLGQFSQNMSRQGLSLEQYLSYTGLDMEAFRENFKPQAEKQISGNLVLEQIANAEGFEVTDEEYEKEIEQRASQYKVETDKFRDFISEEYKDLIKGDIKIQKAVELLSETAVVK
ncbi:MAG: trigger factor [Epulopiscium sp. Nuni2H_MBin003]|nr:MAG: trigger factor [Epulopiscium sp. Nuni2H_MBin003]